jgi:hypothetical protein
MNWFTELGPPLFFWVMLALMAAGLAGAIVAALRKRYGIAFLSGVLGIGIGLLILFWGNMGAFCVAPPGAACA